MPTGTRRGAASVARGPSSLDPALLLSCLNGPRLRRDSRVMQVSECAGADYCFDRPTVRRPTSAIATSKPPPGADVGVVLCHGRSRESALILQRGPVVGRSRYRIREEQSPAAVAAAVANQSFGGSDECDRGVAKAVATA